MKENLSKAWKIFYKEKYPKFWIKQSRIYLEGKTGRPYFSEIIRFINPARREKILECGIGTGEPMALWLAENETKIFGVDIALSLLLICKRKFENKGLKVNCVEADIENIPFRDNYFDKVYSISTTWYIPDIEKGLAEMVRVTKKGE